MTCPKCEVCNGASHHWMVNPEVDYDGQTDYICKHCPATGEECGDCDGTGADTFDVDCEECNGEGVLICESPPVRF